MHFDEIIYATQYYRSPTPLENEWEYDLSRLSFFNLDTIQIRINWRNNERKEDVYNFDDIDKLMTLSEKYNKKVIIKFLLECAPQYIFDKYDGTRIGPKGEMLRGGSHGAFYVGGWLPCFTNPKVKERMIKFVEVVTKRYADRQNIIMWNAWNEPRNRPIEECFCPACRKGFGEYLKNKYKTIEALNKKYGVSEESFENIALPSMAHGHWDIYEFKLYKSEQCIYDNLKAVYEAIRKYDTKRPIISHSGFPAAFQNQLGDCLSDAFVSKAVDMWGTSIPCDTTMDTLDKRLDFNLLNDYLLSISKDYFLYEIYPGLGMYKYPYDTEWDMTYKLNTAIASGAKGLNFWQYRSERVGHESDCAGLCRMDGSPRPVLNAVREFDDILNHFKKDIVNYYKKPAEVAILFDYKSLLMSEIEDCSGFDYSFNMFWNVEYYRKSHAGFYRLLKRMDYDIDYVQSSNIEEIFKYKVIYIPNMEIYDAHIIEILDKFANNGGIIIADEGFLLRDENTWVNPYDLKCPHLCTARINERRKKDNQVVYNNVSTNITGYTSVFNADEGEVVMRFSSDEAAITKFNNFYLCGFSLGYNSFEENNEVISSFIKELLFSLNIKPIKYSCLVNGIEVRRLDKDNLSYLFITNCCDKEVNINLTENIEEVITGNINNNVLNIAKESTAIIKISF